MLYSCSKCGRIHERGAKCKGQSLPRTAEQALRNKNAWHKKARAVRELSFNICAVCLAAGDYHPKAVEVHHITKLRDNPEGLLSDDNLVCLCIDHHKQADAGQIPPEYLRELAERRERGETWTN